MDWMIILMTAFEAILAVVFVVYLFCSAYTWVNAPEYYTELDKYTKTSTIVLLGCITLQTILNIIFLVCVFKSCV